MYKKNLLLVLRGRHKSDLALMRLAQQVANQQNLKIYVCLNEKKNYDFNSEKVKIEKKFQSFSYNPFFLINSLVILGHSLILLIKNLLLLKIKGFEWFKFNFKIQGLFFGDLFIDSYNRYYCRFLNKKISIFTLSVLFVLIFKTLYLKKKFKKYSFRAVITHHSGYKNNGSISCKIAVEKNLLVLEPYGKNHIKWNKELIKNGIYHLKSNKHFSKSFENYKQNKKKISKFINDRFENKVNTNYTHYLDLKNSVKFKKNNIKFLNSLKLKNKIKKTVLIAPHAFSDATHVDGNSFIFQDYYEQLKETLLFIKNKKIENILWIVRPHPTSAYYNEQGIVEDLVKKISDKKIINCPKQVSTKEILNISDLVITGKGTIGLEAASLGKFVINASGCLYSSFGFSLDPKNKNEYFKSILNIIKIQKLKNKKIFLAKCILYYLEKDCLIGKCIREYNTKGFSIDKFTKRSILIN